MDLIEFAYNIYWLISFDACLFIIMRFHVFIYLNIFSCISGFFFPHFSRVGGTKSHILTDHRIFIFWKNPTFWPKMWDFYIFFPHISMAGGTKSHILTDLFWKNPTFFEKNHTFWPKMWDIFIFFPHFSRAGGTKSHILTDHRIFFFFW